MTKKNNKMIFVSPSDDGWKVQRPGKERASGIFDKKEEAREKAIDIAKNNKLELCVQKLNGQIGEKNSYGEDHCPPKG